MSSTAEEKRVDVSDGAEVDIEELAAKLRGALEIKDRRYHLTTYPKCFVGSDAVDKMIDLDWCLSREEALRLGNLMMSAGLFLHVTKDHAFKDDKLFYRFFVDAGHGTKLKNEDTQSDWSWGDLLTKFSKKDTTISYQSAMEPLSVEVSSVTVPRTVDADTGVDTFGVSPMDALNQELLDNVHPIKWKNPAAKSKYNLVAIGAGAGGLVSCAGSAGLGAVTAIIEEKLFGGDCLNSGCVPSKALLACAKAASIATRHAEEFGLIVEGTIRVDFGKVMERMRGIRAKISKHDACARFTKEYGMDVFLGRAQFISENQIKVGDSVLEFARAVIATGAVATAPCIEGLDTVEYLSSHSLWNLTAMPESLTVLGSGPIGCEMAQAFALFGCKVTVLNRSDRILGKEDAEAAAVLREHMTADGVTFYTGLKFGRVYYGGGDEEKESGGDDAVAVDSTTALGSGKKEIHFEFEEVATGERKTVVSEALLVATGRKPNVAGMGLAKAGVKFDLRKGVFVNDYLQTSNGSVYAVGDCCTRYQFTHMAEAMARIVIRNALFFGRSKMSDLVLPWVTYTSPEIAHVGLYKHDLVRKGIAFDVHRVDLKHNDRAICESQEYGFVKVLCRKGSDKILGATIVSENAGDQINELTLAIQTNVGLGFIAGVIHAYPTVAEAIKQTADVYNRTKLTPITKTLLRKILSMRR